MVTDERTITFSNLLGVFNVFFFSFKVTELSLLDNWVGGTELCFTYYSAVT